MATTSGMDVEIDVSMGWLYESVLWEWNVERNKNICRRTVALGLGYSGESVITCLENEIAGLNEELRGAG